MAKRKPASPSKLAKMFGAPQLQARLAVVLAAIARVTAAISEQESRRQLAFLDIGERVAEAQKVIDTYSDVESWEDMPQNSTEEAARLELETLEARCERLTQAIEKRAEADAEAAQAEAATGTDG